MDKIYHNGYDKYVAAVQLYATADDGFLYYDKTGTTKVKVTNAELVDMFVKGSVINFNNKVYQPACLSESVNGYGIVTVCSDAANYNFFTSEAVPTLSVAAESGLTTILGETVSDLQSGVVITNDEIVGTLKYVTDFTQYSTVVEEQSGNYIALKMTSTTPTSETVTTTVELIGGPIVEPVTLDSNMNTVLRIVDKDLQKIKVTSATDGVSTVKTYDLSGLTLTPSV